MENPPTPGKTVPASASASPDATASPGASVEADAPANEGTPANEGPPASDAPTPTDEPKPESKSAPSESPSEASAEAKEKKKKKRKRSALRERVARDHEIERLRRRELLVLKLPVALAGLAALGLVVFLARAPLLRAVAHTNGSVGRWAVERLAKMRDSASFSLYVEQLGRDNDTQTFNELVFLGAGHASIPASGEDPAQEDPERISEHLSILSEAVRGDDPVMRRGALYALWTLRNRSWTRDAAILQGAAKLLDPPCEDDVARRFAALVLKASPAPEATHEALLRAALEDTDRMVRRQAVEALGKAGDPRLGPRLVPALEDPFPEVRREASMALARLKADLDLGTLEDLYRSEDSGLRSEVLELIASRPEEDAVRILLEALSANAWATRRVAVRGLAGRRGAHVLRGLRDALVDPDPSVRLAAIDALGHRQDAKAILPSLNDALRRHQGWQEIRALHAALVALTGADVPAPTPLQATWPACIDGWDAYLQENVR